MPPKKNASNNRKPQEPRLPSKFRQDITGILLIAVAIFILISNLSPSTGLVGLFLIERALRSVIGVGIYVLPLFIGLYGLIMLIRHEVKELTVRLAGLLVLFLVFITIAQFAAPVYFAGPSDYKLVEGAGGAIGFASKYAMEKTIGIAGAYVLLSALGLIGTLLILNITVQSLLAAFISLFRT